MGLLSIVRERDEEARETTKKLKKATMLLNEVCEDVEEMEQKYSERGGYRDGYRGGYREYGSYREDDEIEYRRHRR